MTERLNKEQQKVLLELCDALIKHLYKYPTEGLSLPFITINMQCGRLDRIVDYLNDFENRKRKAEGGDG